MASITLQLDDETFQELIRAAQKVGVAPERMAEMMVETSLLADNSLAADDRVSEPARAWAGATDGSVDTREDNASNYGLNETGRPWSEVRPEFMALIDKTFGKAE